VAVALPEWSARDQGEPTAAGVDDEAATQMQGASFMPRGTCAMSSVPIR
jgi:hypothetical protein